MWCLERGSDDDGEVNGTYFDYYVTIALVEVSDKQ